MVTLFEDQARDVHALRVLFREHRCVLYALPTGGGKTVCAGFIAERMRQKNLKILILVHRRELIKQFFETLKSVGLHRHISIVCPGYTPTPWAPIQLAMVYSWARRKPKFQPDVVIVDEAHHIKAQTWLTVLNWYEKALVFGMTATPIRLDGKALDPPFTALHCGDSIGTLIKKKRLSPVRVLRVPVGFLSGDLSKRFGEYNKKELDQKADAKVVVNAANAYVKYIPGVRTLMFGVSKRHARETAQELARRNVRAAYVGDDTEAPLRDEIFQKFGNGDIDVVCNVGLVDEGFDAPACVAVMDVSPTLSIARYLQRIGRALRYQENKEAILLCLAGNTYRHGLPDIDRIWSLEKETNGTPVKESENGFKLKCCTECLTLFPKHLTECPHCGAAPDPRPLREIDVELEEVISSMPKKKIKREGAEDKGPKMTLEQRNSVLHDARRLLHQNKETEAWHVLRDAGVSAGYPPNWKHVMADMIGINERYRE